MKPDPKEVRRREILMAALKAFAEKGYDKTTVEDIVRLSGLSKGTLYWYFANKEAIFAGLIQMVLEEIWRAFEMALQQTASEPPRQRLPHLLAGIVPMEPETETGNWTGLYADFFNQAWQNKTLGDLFRQSYVRYIEAIALVVQQGIEDGSFRPVDPRQTAQMLVGALDGYYFQQILDMGAAAPVLAQYAETIVRGLMKDNASDQ